ncbi:hypothetical protein KR074_007700 [Drosophila pseudoananassae]|nr:hypothetical protein KR074_007700 [Drosophila pseudoananassae]
MEHIEKFRANKVRDETRPEPALERAGNREDTPGEKVEKNEFGEGDKPQPGEGQARREYGEAGVVEQGMGRGQGQGDGHGDQQGEETSTSTGETEQGTSSEGTNGIGSGTSSSEYVNQNTDISSEYTPKSVDSLTSEWGQSPRPSTTTLTGDDNTSSEVGNGPTRPCSPDADYVPPELIPLFEGRANFDLSKEDASESSDVFRSLTEESVEEEVQPSTSAHSAAKARIIAARAKREKQKTAKRAKIWPKTVAVRGQRGGRPVKEQSIKLIPGSTLRLLGGSPLGLSPH